MNIAADSHAAPCARQCIATVLANDAIARDTYQLRLEAPALAQAILPGQFVMIRPGPGPAPLFGRPFALYDVVCAGGAPPHAFDIVYIVLGQGTAELARRRPGERLDVWGPLGNGFGPPPQGPALFVAGGIGQTPFLALARWWLGQAAYGNGGERVKTPAVSATLLYGVRSADLLSGVADFKGAGVSVEVATDDGSAGHHGFVTELLLAHLSHAAKPAKVVACGPHGMLAAVADLTTAHSVACDVSLENHMACGFGACFSCVAPIRQPDGSTDLRRVCTEGPVFPAQNVVW